MTDGDRTLRDVLRGYQSGAVTHVEMEQILQATGLDRVGTLARLRDDLAIASAARAAYHGGGLDARTRFGRFVAGTVRRRS